MPTKQEWVVKGKVEKKTVKVDEDGFQEVSGGIKKKAPNIEGSSRSTTVSNPYAILGDLEEARQDDNRKEGGGSSLVNG